MALKDIDDDAESLAYGQRIEYNQATAEHDPNRKVFSGVGTLRLLLLMIVFTGTAMQIGIKMQSAVIGFLSYEAWEGSGQERPAADEAAVERRLQDEQRQKAGFQLN